MYLHGSALDSSFITLHPATHLLQHNDGCLLASWLLLAGVNVHSRRALVHLILRAAAVLYWILRVCCDAPPDPEGCSSGSFPIGVRASSLTAHLQAQCRRCVCVVVEGAMLPDAQRASAHSWHVSCMSSGLSSRYAMCYRYDDAMINSTSARMANAWPQDRHHNAQSDDASCTSPFIRWLKRHQRPRHCEALQPAARRQITPVNRTCRLLVIGG